MYTHAPRAYIWSTTLHDELQARVACLGCVGQSDCDTPSLGLLDLIKSSSLEARGRSPRTDRSDLPRGSPFR